MKYWLKIIHCRNAKYVNIVYDMLVKGFNSHPNKVSWEKLLYDLLGGLGFIEVWVQQNVGDECIFLSLITQSLKDIFIPSWNARLKDSSPARFYRNLNNFEYISQ